MSPNFCFTATNKCWLYTSGVSREENRWGRFVSVDIPQHPHLIRLGISRTSMDTVLSLQGLGWQHGQSQETYGTGGRLHHELNTKNIDMTVTWLFSFKSPYAIWLKTIDQIDPRSPKCEGSAPKAITFAGPSVPFVEPALRISSLEGFVGIPLSTRANHCSSCCCTLWRSCPRRFWQIQR